MRWSSAWSPLSWSESFWSAGLNSSQALRLRSRARISTSAAPPCFIPATACSALASCPRQYVSVPWPALPVALPMRTFTRADFLAALGYTCTSSIQTGLVARKFDAARSCRSSSLACGR